MTQPGPLRRDSRLAGESPDPTAAREELQLAEIELMRHREAVAAQRRALPPGPLVQDYTLLEGPGSLDDGDQPVREVRLSELFSAPERPLVIYQFMYGKQQTSPCPMCTLWIDGYNGVAHHLARNIDFAILAAADPAQLRAHARRRGWNRLRLLSAGDSTIKYDLDSEDEQGAQISTVSVFTRDADGAIRHQYSAHPRMSDTIDQRGIDLLSPVWHLLDLTPRAATTGTRAWTTDRSAGQAPAVPVQTSRRRTTTNASTIETTGHSPSTIQDSGTVAKYIPLPGPGDQFSTSRFQAVTTIRWLTSADQRLDSEKNGGSISRVKAVVTMDAALCRISTPRPSPISAQTGASNADTTTARSTPGWVNETPA